MIYIYLTLIFKKSSTNIKMKNKIGGFEKGSTCTLGWSPYFFGLLFEHIILEMDTHGKIS